MKAVHISKLQADPITKALIDAKGEATPLVGYIHSTSDEFIRISTSRGSESHIECPKKDVLAAFEGDEKPGNIFLLVANNAQIRIISHFKAHELNERKHCKCNNETGVAEARPLGTIHPALAALAAQERALRALAGTGPGARELSCNDAFHDSVINGEDVDRAEIVRKICLFES